MHWHLERTRLCCPSASNYPWRENLSLTSSSSCLLPQGSLVLTSCLATAALTLASSPTSVPSARRSSPAVTTCPNTPRFTAVPGPAGLSEPPCEPLKWPRTVVTPAGPTQFWPGHSGNSLRAFGRRTWQDSSQSSLLCLSPLFPSLPSFSLPLHPSL